MSTACTHMYADCQLQNTPTKQNKYVVNRKFEHVDDNFLVEPFYCGKIISLHKVFVFTFDIFFNEIKVDQLP